MDIFSNVYHYSYGYPTENKWIDNETVILARSKSYCISKKLDRESENELVTANVKTGAVYPLCTGVTEWLDYLAYRDDVYYVKNDTLYRINAKTKEDNALTHLFGAGFPHITNDGKYISLFNSDLTPTRFYRYSVTDRRLEPIFERAFPTPHAVANHGMISPTDKDTIFFAHEGDTRFIADRLNLYNVKTKSEKNLAYQRFSDGMALDCFGHESWARDGSGLYFVKFSESIDQSGICFCGINDTKCKVLFSKYDYWHVSVSPCGKYLAADTRGKNGESGIVLIDILKGKEHLIDSVPVTFRHPCHPHPAFSPHSDKLLYHFQKDGMTSVRITDI